MRRARALKIVLVLVGLVFSAGIYPVVTSVRQGWEANKEDALPMMLSLYVTLGIFLLLAARNPPANRSVIPAPHGRVLLMVLLWRSCQPTFRTNAEIRWSPLLCLVSSEQF